MHHIVLLAVESGILAFMQSPVLPQLYSRWIGELLEAPVPEETEATCMDCPMISRDPERNKSEFLFRPDTKCCTYWPELVNFLAGNILLDESPESARGRAAFQSRCAADAILTPMGVSPSTARSELYKRKIHTFGVNPELLCPYYLQEEGGLCGIWKHRNSRCATWFCKFTRGSVGVIFWKYMDLLLQSVEKTLARWCVMQLDIGPEATRRLFPPAMTAVDLNSDLWGPWASRKLDFYTEASRLVNPLTWYDIASICGADVKLYARILRQTHFTLTTPKLPKKLKYGNWKKQRKIADGMYRIWTYNRYDPIDLPEKVVSILMYFNGRSTEETLLQLKTEKGIALEPELLQTLSDFGVLEAE